MIRAEEATMDHVDAIAERLHKAKAECKKLRKELSVESGIVLEAAKALKKALSTPEQEHTIVISPTRPDTLATYVDELATQRDRLREAVRVAKEALLYDWGTFASSSAGAALDAISKCGY